MNPSAQDLDFMRRALSLAARGAGRVNPNPLVGAVLVRDGRIIGEGYHAYFGGPHAERDALAHCTEGSGRALPCTSRSSPAATMARPRRAPTPSWSTALPRVVVGSPDPNPLVAGGGVRIFAGAWCLGHRGRPARGM